MYRRLPLFLLLITVLLSVPTFAPGNDEIENGKFWTEVDSSGRLAKAQILPDFVDLASKLSPAVVNISSEEGEEGAEDPHSHPRSPFEEYGPRAKSLGSGFVVTKDGYV